jgi:hypothetical protein
MRNPGMRRNATACSMLIGKGWVREVGRGRGSVARDKPWEEEAMGQGPKLDDLQQRVEAVGSRFGEISEDSRRRGERLADLLDEVESGFLRDRLEMDRLTQALAKAQEENAQILDLLQTLLATSEHAGGLGERAVLYDLEARVDRLYDQTVLMNGADELPEEELEDSDGATRAAGNGALSAAAPAADPDGAGPEDQRWEPIPEEDDDVDDGDPLELTRRVGEDGARTALEPIAGGARTAETGAVMDIFKRVSMITGRLRET